MISTLLRMALVGLLIYGLLRLAGAVLRALTGGRLRQPERRRPGGTAQRSQPGFDFKQEEVLDVSYRQAPESSGNSEPGGSEAGARAPDEEPGPGGEASAGREASPVRDASRGREASAGRKASAGREASPGREASAGRDEARAPR